MGTACLGYNPLQALCAACRYLDAASSYFVREIGIDESRERLDIGKPGRDGNPV